ncbi:MAG: isoleucine--tRNA ligase [Candidatus Woesearchaeota archaeon]
MAGFNPLDYEEKIQEFWDKDDIYKKVKDKAKGKQKFYFLDGPPYTSGRVHVGTAWNKTLKDSVLRYKRMCGYDVLDRAGYDMHGLPTENATERKLGFKSKDEIPKFGVGKFIKACKELSQENLKLMNDDFKRLGVWMDFDDAYQTISNDYINGEWWLVKRAHEKGRLYEGFRAMAWDWAHETACAKHELEYKTITDTSIFVKMKIQGTDNDYILIWTTTPWTIPFNLGVMAHPDFEYVKCKVEGENWIMAKALANIFLSSVAQKDFEITETFKGKELEGTRYIHPFYEELKGHYDQLKEDSEKVHTIVMSEEFVDTTAGTGLVHMAPGCGPEDYEVGHRNKIPAWNLLEPNGKYPENMGKFAGRHALHDNKSFISDLKEKGALVATNEVEHEYPHAQRSKEPVVFRTTKQWFFKMEDMKEKMIEENDKVNWVPDAGYNAFNSWLNNLRDNSISKQRYWGTPLPVWRNEKDEDDYIVVGSLEELEELAGEKVEEPHIPWIDDIVIKKDGKTYRRVPDVLDVWVDAGTASWNSLNFPMDKEAFDKNYPADFILEGKDQIRGWFNLLHVASMLAFDKPAFKAVYMHGYVQDAYGRKFSKSEGNYVPPDEIVSKYGADTLRYYMIGGTSAGVDINYNFDDMKVRYKNLSVLWNIQNYILDLADSIEIKDISKIDKKSLSIEDRFILSRLNSTISEVTGLFERYKLDDVPDKVEALFLELSRTYLQLTREKAANGDENDKITVIKVSAHVLLETLKMFSTIVPFISEKIYLNLKEKFLLKEESIHLFSWPTSDDSMIDKELERSMDYASSVIQTALGVRERMQRGVRWPVSKMLYIPQDEATSKALEETSSLIMSQINARSMEKIDSLPGMKYKIKPDFAKIADIAGRDTQEVANAIMDRDAQEIVDAFDKKGVYPLDHKDKKYDITPELVKIERIVPDGYFEGEFRGGLLYLETAMDDNLEAEGYVREVARRIQDARKTAGLKKNDKINIQVECSERLKDIISKDKKALERKVGGNIQFEKKKNTEHNFSHRIKEEEISISF